MGLTDIDCKRRVMPKILTADICQSMRRGSEGRLTIHERVELRHARFLRTEPDVVGESLQDLGDHDESSTYLQSRCQWDSPSFPCATLTSRVSDERSRSIVSGETMAGLMNLRKKKPPILHEASVQYTSVEEGGTCAVKMLSGNRDPTASPIK